jgi:hypothetical protein
MPFRSPLFPLPMNIIFPKKINNPDKLTDLIPLVIFQTTGLTLFKPVLFVIKM